LFSLLWAVLGSGPLNRGVDAAWFAIAFGALAVYSLAVHYGTRLIRNRITYPRTGFVRPRVRKIMVAVPVLAATVVAAALAVLFSHRPGDPRLISAFAGFLIGAAFLYKGWRMETGRFLLVGVIAMAAGLAAPLLTPDLAAGQALLFTIVGAALLISGAATLRSYLHTTSRPEDSAE
jgi:hypothetical protein